MNSSNRIKLSIDLGNGNPKDKVVVSLNSIQKRNLIWVV